MSRLYEVETSVQFAVSKKEKKKKPFYGVLNSPWSMWIRN